jgi:hypothetical protein
MAVLQTVSRTNCKICSSPERRRIETLLEHRHHRRKDSNGVRINLEYVKARMLELGVKNPTLENVTLHVSRHMEFVEDSRKLHKLDSGRKTALKLRTGTPHVDIDENLRWMISVGRSEIEDRLIRGEKSGITTDHILKATDALTRRQHNEAQHELLGALVGGIGHAIGAVPAQALNPVPEAIVLELEAAEIAEFEDKVVQEIRTQKQQIRAESLQPQNLPDWVTQAQAKEKT